jgi:hypothetical protein
VPRFDVNLTCDEFGIFKVLNPDLGSRKKSVRKDDQVALRKAGATGNEERLGTVPCSES